MREKPVGCVEAVFALAGVVVGLCLGGAALGLVAAVAWGCSGG